MRSGVVSLLLLLTIQCHRCVGQVEWAFVNPPPSTADKGDLVWYIGDTQELSWESNGRDVWLTIKREPPGQSMNETKLGGKDASTEGEYFNWVVEPMQSLTTEQQDETEYHFEITDYWSDNGIPTARSRRFYIRQRPESTSKGLSTPAIVGISVGATAGVLMALGGLGFMLWGRRKRSQQDAAQSQLQSPELHFPVTQTASPQAFYIDTPENGWRKTELLRSTPSELFATSHQPSELDVSRRSNDFIHELESNRPSSGIGTDPKTQKKPGHVDEV